MTANEVEMECELRRQAEARAEKAEARVQSLVDECEEQSHLLRAAGYTHVPVKNGDHASKHHWAAPSELEGAMRSALEMLKQRERFDSRKFTNPLKYHEALCQALGAQVSRAFTEVVGQHGKTSGAEDWALHNQLSSFTIGGETLMLKEEDKDP